MTAGKEMAELVLKKGEQQFSNDPAQAVYRWEVWELYLGSGNSYLGYPYQIYRLDNFDGPPVFKGVLYELPEAQRA